MHDLQPDVGFFGNYNLVQGGEFIQHNVVVNGAKDGFDRLLGQVSTSAFHNSAERIEPPKCHPNTREAILQKIFDWILASKDRKAWLLWLNGAAGSGKSAIAQSIAELCVKRKIAVISFFFFRTDPTRNNAKYLVGTLAYQICKIVPGVKEIVVKAIEDDPLIFSQSLESQLESLVAEPLRQCYRSRSASLLATVPFLLMIIDGIDECSDADTQPLMIRAIVSILASKDLPLICIIASRAENNISMTFSEQTVQAMLLRIALDHHYLPDKDIRLFLNDNFTKIKYTHPFRRHLDLSWPPPEVVEELVTMSSGQFIYASVVVQFLLSSRAHPAQQLEVVRGLRRAHGILTPFTQLDALYQHIFSQVTNINLVLKILAFVILGNVDDTRWVSQFFGITVLDLETALADLVSVIDCQNKIRFLHASLQDFLHDPARSQQFQINFVASSTQLSHIWYNNTWTYSTISDWSIVVILRFLRYADPTPQLQDDILTFQPKRVWNFVHPSFFPAFLSVVKTLYFNDDGKAYKRQLRLITPLIRERRPDYIPELAKNHDIDDILEQLQREEDGVLVEAPSVKRNISHKIKTALSPRKFSFSQSDHLAQVKLPADAHQRPWSASQ